MEAPHFWTANPAWPGRVHRGSERRSPTAPRNPDRAPGGRAGSSPTLAWASRQRFRELAGIGSVIVLACILYGVGLSRNGYANEYYAAAVHSMTQSWKAFFFGSIDSVGFITIDKPPFALWVQALVSRLFGFSSWSILLPQGAAALAGVMVLYHLARQRFGTLAATLTALILVLTPITVAVSRDNIPDAILILLLTGAAWGTLAAIRTGRLTPLLMAAVLVGLGFNTKMLQAYLVIPAFVGTYALAAPGSIQRRIAHLLAAAVVMTGVSASWMLIVDAIPADARPYIGGSTNNSVLDLVLGYNGLGRILGRDGVLGSADGGGAGGRNFGGVPGWGRLFNTQVGGQIAWLLPMAAASLLTGLASRGLRSRTDDARAWYLLWGGWLATHFVVFSLAEGTFHPYYTSAMAPAIAALCGPGLVSLWSSYRRSWMTAWILPVALGSTAVLSLILINQSTWLPWLGPAVVGGTITAIVGLGVGRLARFEAGRYWARAAVVVGFVAIMAGPAAWSITPLQSAVMGVNPTAGPTDTHASGFGGGPGPGPNSGGQFSPASDQRVDEMILTSGRASSFPGRSPRGGPGGRMSAEMIAYLQQQKGNATYLVAVKGANTAASIILATDGEPVIAMGGFTNSDPAPTVSQLESLVASGELRFVLLGGGQGGGPGGSTSDVDQWVQANGTLIDASVYAGSSGQQLYDLGAFAGVSIPTRGNS